MLFAFKKINPDKPGKAYIVDFVFENAKDRDEAVCLLQNEMKFAVI